MRKRDILKKKKPIDQLTQEEYDTLFYDKNGVLDEDAVVGYALKHPAIQTPEEEAEAAYEAIMESIEEKLPP